jgi:integrase/recombinase XerD
MVLLASEIGARNASLRRIRLSDVHLDEKYVQLENTKSDRVYTVPISTEMTLELERWIQVERDKSSTSLDSPYLFPGVYKDKLENSSSLWRIVTEAAERAGIQEVVDEREPTEAERRQGTLEGPYRQYRVNPHLLRHTFSSLLEEAGLDSEARRDALDHEDVETTQEYYTHTGSDYEPLMRKLFHGENPGRD